MNIVIFSDYVCPFCFIGEEVLKNALISCNIKAHLEWIHIELRPYPQPTLKPEGEYLQTIWTETIYPMAEKLNMPLKLPKVSPQPYSRNAIIGYLIANEAGLGNIYNTNVFKAFFYDELDIGKIDILQKIAIDSGLDASEFSKNLSNPVYIQKHEENLKYAGDVLKINAVPTFIIENHLIRGLPQKEDLIHLLNSIKNKPPV